MTVLQRLFTAKELLALDDAVPPLMKVLRPVKEDSAQLRRSKRDSNANGQEKKPLNS